MRTIQVAWCGHYPNVASKRMESEKVVCKHQGQIIICKNLCNQKLCGPNNAKTNAKTEEHKEIRQIKISLNVHTHLRLRDSMNDQFSKLNYVVQRGKIPDALASMEWAHQLIVYRNLQHHMHRNNSVQMKCVSNLLSLSLCHGLCAFSFFMWLLLCLPIIVGCWI